MRYSITEILRFGIVGAVATAVHLAILTLAIEHLALSPSPANGIAFIGALLITYVGQNLWVFRESSKHSLLQMLRFLVSIVVGLFANVGIMALSVHVLELRYQSGFVLGLLLMPALSFAINRFWVFRGGGTDRLQGRNIA